jgi:uncharacterized protein YbjT (DUF2867 family)
MALGGRRDLSGPADPNHQSVSLRLAGRLSGRLVADRLGKTWGQPVLVESKSGAGGTVGANFVAKSPADGYTLLVTSTSPMVARRR